MDDPLCHGCSVSMQPIPDPSGYPSWTCPTCGRRQVNIELSDEMTVKDSLGIEGRSTAMTPDGLPEREFSRFAGEGGESSAHDVDRGASASAVTRSVKHPTPYRRDAAGRTKREEEVEAVRRLLPRYNEIHETSFTTVAADSSDADADVIADGVLKFQVTVADRKPWRDLSKPNAAYEEQLQEDELLQRFLDAARAKRTRAASDLILVLDGTGLSTSEGTLRRFARECETELAQIGFAEIWWSDRQRCLRLYPVEQ